MTWIRWGVMGGLLGSDTLNSSDSTNFSVPLDKQSFKNIRLGASAGFTLSVSYVFYLSD